MALLARRHFQPALLCCRQMSGPRSLPVVHLMTVSSSGTQYPTFPSYPQEHPPSNHPLVLSTFSPRHAHLRVQEQVSVLHQELALVLPVLQDRHANRVPRASSDRIANPALKAALPVMKESPALVDVCHPKSQTRLLLAIV